MEIMDEATVMIVGAGPSGLAVSACLKEKRISNIILEKDESFAPLWKKRAYDRLHLHLAKEFCSLPLKPHSASAPTYMNKDEFIKYLNDYVSYFAIKPHYSECVFSTSYDESEQRWTVIAQHTKSREVHGYSSKFLVIASGENSKSYIPHIPGQLNFEGISLHSSQYKSGSNFRGKDVLVIGCGNSGMEICYDLANHGARSSIVVRSQIHVVSRWMIRLGMHLLRYLPLPIVDSLVLFGAKFVFGDLSKYGINRPSKGPFALKLSTGRSPVIDVGTISKIESGEIKVMPGILEIKRSSVLFENNVEHTFDAIVYATGYGSAACDWLKEHSSSILGENGLPKHRPPNHWKGEKGTYCAGLSQMGLFGISKDAEAIANDIHTIVGSV
ncbi:hypothetical protein Ancab_026804 [Ancistrocladus abbreviatus]